MLRSLGSEVVLVVRGVRLLRQFDALLADKLLDAMRASGIEMVTDGAPRAARGAGRSHARSRWTAGAWPIATVAVGHRPHAADRGPGPRGRGRRHRRRRLHRRRQVPEHERTRIYAVGDVTGRAVLTPVAIAAGRRLADRVFGGQPDRHLSYDLIPTVVFSHPPIGTVGLSEQAARERFAGEPIRVYQTEFVSMFYGLTTSSRRPR